MEDKKTYYENALYPLQDKIIEIVNKVTKGFYLTGGTCLSRGYFNHRYSDDLDFFVNDSDDFALEFNAAREAIVNSFDAVQQVESERYKKMDVYSDGNIRLALDFVNDIPFRHGNSQESSLGRIDNPYNILINKITALIGRTEAKDVVDFWMLCKRLDFSFDEVFEEARNKEANVDANYIANVIRTMPEEAFNSINWIKVPDYGLFHKDIETIAKRIVSLDVNIGQSYY